MTAPRVSIILPGHNQADNIEEIVAEYERALALLPAHHETVLVVNGSRDRSLAICPRTLRRVTPASSAPSKASGAAGGLR